MMAIKNPDGSEYCVTGNFSQYDPNSVEHDLFNVWDQEAIEIGGTPLLYYEVFINLSSIDELYVEARDKLWSNHPVEIHGYYDPRPSENMMTAFGIDSPMSEMMMELNYRAVLSQIGHVPKIGSRIYSPHKQENWVIIQRNVEVFQMWGELRLQIMCNRFQESLTTGSGRVSQNQPNFKTDDVKDLSRGSNNTNFAGGQRGPQ